jgi:hypothetical protein
VPSSQPAAKLPKAKSAPKAKPVPASSPQAQPAAAAAPAKQAPARHSQGSSAKKQRRSAEGVDDDDLPLMALAPRPAAPRKNKTTPKQTKSKLDSQSKRKRGKKARTLDVDEADLDDFLGDEDQGDDDFQRMFSPPENEDDDDGDDDDGGDGSDGRTLGDAVAEPARRLKDGRSVRAAFGKRAANANSPVAWMDSYARAQLAKGKA